MELAGALPPPTEKFGRGAKPGRPAAAGVKKNVEDSEEIPELEDNESAILMDDDEMGVEHSEPVSTGHAPEVELA
ncbi:MAG: hypothetical protein P4M08_12455 [Oligoflexia bacterium]|nr:hypothetical protein [Oligoflexia bacterium]